MSQHKHADCIIARAEGKEIQCKANSGRWVDIDAPQWRTDNEYRIKPVKHTGWMCLYRHPVTGGVYGGPVCPTKDNALSGYDNRRIAVIPIEFEETL